MDSEETTAPSLWERVRAVFSPRPRPTTAAERRLAATVDRQTILLSQKDGTIRDQKAQIEELRSSVKIRESELQLMTDVLARDRARVEAETAIYAARTALATSPPPTE